MDLYKALSKLLYFMGKETNRIGKRKRTVNIDILIHNNWRILRLVLLAISCLRVAPRKISQWLMFCQSWAGWWHFAPCLCCRSKKGPLEEVGNHRVSGPKQNQAVVVLSPWFCSQDFPVSLITEWFSSFISFIHSSNGQQA